MKNEIQMIRTDRIRILNPRHRDKAKFEVIVESIKNLGLKKPIQVSRIEAFQALGYEEIPAEVVEISKEDRLLRSLVENMARRAPSAFDLIPEIERLKKLGYTNTVIGKKLDMSDTAISNLLLLCQEGEERLLDETMRGYIPLWIAVEISKTETIEAQRELLKAYEQKKVTQTSIRAIKRLIEQRRFLGKKYTQDGSEKKKSRTSAESLVAAYRRECERQKLLTKKARLCESKLVVLVAAFKNLLDDEDFVNLLRAEGLPTMPTFLAEKISNPHSL